jgi:SAM-dependent methyltransferase
MSYVRDTQDFFEPRAAGWEARFPDDDPLFEAAIGQLHIRPGTRVLDAGCGTGRALPFLRKAVGEAGDVVGADLTPGMISEAAQLGRGSLAHLLVADVMRLPFSPAQFELVFAAGLIPHLVEPQDGLLELARVTRPGGTLAVFHPIGRAALAARHGGVPSEGDALAAARLRRMLEATGWSPEIIDDAADRYLALAVRRDYGR